MSAQDNMAGLGLTSIRASSISDVVSVAMALFAMSIGVRGQPTCEPDSKIVHSDGMISDNFGYSVSVWGTTAIVGVPEDDCGDDDYTYCGSARVLNFDGSSWSATQTLSTIDVEGSACFGHAVAIQGSTAVITNNSDCSGATAGFAFVFERDGTRFVRTQILQGEGSYFGSDVSISVNRMALGAGSWSVESFVHIYEHDGLIWQKTHTIENPSQSQDSAFGATVALAGDVLLIGDPLFDPDGVLTGTSYVYRYDGTDWKFEQDLGVRGSSLAAVGQTLVIGSENYDPELKTAYVFEFNGTNWVRIAELAVSDGENPQQFGKSVAYDGSTILIGAPGDDQLGDYAGSAYVYRRQGDDWVESRKLWLLDGAAGDSFGVSVAVFGDFAAVGAPYDDAVDSNLGSVGIFANIAEDCNGNNEPDFCDIVTGQSVDGLPVAGDGFPDECQEDCNANLVPDDFDIATGASLDCYPNGVPDECDLFSGTSQDKDADDIPDECEIDCETRSQLEALDAKPDEHFGSPVAISGDIAAVSSYHVNVPDGHCCPTYSGYVYIFRHDGVTWVQEQKLEESPTIHTRGSNLAVLDDWLVVGVDGESVGCMSCSPLPSEVRIYRYGSETWNLTQVLEPDETVPEEAEGFGASLSLSSDKLVIGSTGLNRVYVFGYESGTWVQQAKIEPQDSPHFGSFGNSVAQDGELLLIGASYDDEPEFGSGSAYIFRFDGSTWVEEQKLLPEDGGYLELFGYSVALVQDFALVDGLYSPVRAFRYNGSAWAEEAQLLIPDSVDGDNGAGSIFGFGEAVVVGAPNINGSGAVYIFQLVEETWIIDGTFLLPETIKAGNLGVSVGMDGDHIIAGANFSDEFGADSGLTFVFDRGAKGQDCNANGKYDSCDILAGVSHDCDSGGTPDECEEGDCPCPADLTDDGIVDLFDVFRVLAAFGLTDPGSLALFDVNQDYVINPLDAGYVLSRFGLCPSE